MNIKMNINKMGLTILFLGIGVCLIAGGSYTDNSNGTINDVITDLVWQKCSKGQIYSNGECTGSATSGTWESALSYCENFFLGGRSDWRLPNINELKSLVDFSKYNPAINATYFPNTVSVYYWSATTYAGITTYAWGVYFGSGVANGYYKTDNSYVRCVCTGP
jgi:hypothetical protein